MTIVPPQRDRRKLLEQLEQQVQQLEQAGRPRARPAIRSGCAALDGLLPQQGFRPGTLVEWLALPGGGATTMALLAAREACRQGGALVVVDRPGRFYPPAAAAWKLDLRRVILVRPQSETDEHWACDQALRSPQVAALLCWPERLDSHTFRRWQLAAEASGTLGLLVRGLAARREPSWADVRCLVEPRAGKAEQGRRLQLHLLRCRHRSREGCVEVELESLQRSVAGTGVSTSPSAAS